MAIKIIATLMILSVSLEMSSGSAIPIWEFLARNEKMSYLYSTFAKLVSDHCKTNPDTRTVPVNHCKRDLLNYGYEKLQTFADLQLDTLDPYQRGANELIWATIMRGHPTVASTPSRRPQSTQPPTSMVILTHTNPNNNQPSYPRNPLFDEPERKHTYAMDMDLAYGYAPPPSSAEVSYPQTSYLSGPFVFRVRPDGTPIEEDKNKPYPRDDDLEALQLAKQSKVATISGNKQTRFAGLADQHPTMQLAPGYQQKLRARRQSKEVVDEPNNGSHLRFHTRQLVSLLKSLRH